MSGASPSNGSNGSNGSRSTSQSQSESQSPAPDIEALRRRLDSTDRSNEQLVHILRILQSGTDEQAARVLTQLRASTDVMTFASSFSQGRRDGDGNGNGNPPRNGMRRNWYVNVLHHMNHIVALTTSLEQPINVVSDGQTE